MGLEELKKEIMETTRKRIVEVEQDTVRAVKEIERSLAAKTAEKEQAAQLKLQSELQLIAQMRAAESKSESKQQILEKKGELIGLAMQKAKEAIKRKNKEYLPRLLSKAQLQIEVGQVYCRKEDAKFLNAKTVPQEIGGGIIAETKDGAVSIDYSYGGLLEQIKEKYLFDISEALFK